VVIQEVSKNIFYTVVSLLEVKMIDINKLAKALEDVHSALNGEKNEFVNFYSTINGQLTTPEICKAVVQLDGSELKYVPENLKTQELCKLAVQNSGVAIRYIPKEFITDEICRIAIQNNYFRGDNENEFPRKLLTPDLCLFAVKTDPINIACIPDELKTKELCMIAIQNKGKLLEYVPENLKTEEICQIAIANDERAREFFPKNILDNIFENSESDDEPDGYDFKQEENDKEDKYYSKQYRKRDFEDDRKKQYEREEKNISNTKKEALGVKYYYCKYCGVKNTSVTRLVNESGCQRSPSKKHELYEGSEKSQYTCKYCGVKNSSIMGLVNASGCIKSPSKRHEPAL